MEPIIPLTATPKKTFFGNLIQEIKVNGKAVIAYALYELPYTSSFPGLKTSFQIRTSRYPLILAY